MKVTIMKKANFKSVFSMLVLSIVAGSFLVGCSNSEDLSNELTPKEGMGIVSFSIDEKDYETSGNVTSTRAAAQSQPEIQDLGDGWQAEVSLVPDTTRRPEQKVATRAIYGNKHYTIRAYQGSTLKGEIKGTFNGNNFTPDAGDPGVMQLPHGYYDFVCFNDKVTANGTTLSVNRADIPNAYYTVERNVLINQDPKQKVAFTSKHAGALVHVSLTYINCEIPTTVTTTVSKTEFDPWMGSSKTYYKTKTTNPADQFQYVLNTATNSIPETMSYDFVANTYSYPTMGQLSKSGSLQTDDSYPNATPGSTQYIGVNNIADVYLLPSTDCSNFKLTFTTGELYGKSLAGKSITVPTQKLVERNKQYNLRINLIMENQYLFSDGTIGFLDKNIGKTAIGVVYDLISRSALALKDVTEYSKSNFMWSYNTSSQESHGALINYNQLFTASLSGQVATSTIATQAAQNYTPQLTSKQWIIPDFQRVLEIGSNLGKMASYGKGSRAPHDYSFLIPESASATDFTPSPSSINFPQMNMTRFNAAFTRVGGDPMMGTYWTNTECKDGSEYKQVVVNVGGSNYSISLAPKNSTAKIRPVISF